MPGIMQGGGGSPNAFSSPQLFANGTAAAPSIAANGDPDTGIYWPADAQIAISIEGSANVIWSASAMAFQQAETISTASGDLTVNVAGDLVISGGTAGRITSPAATNLTLRSDKAATQGWVVSTSTGILKPENAGVNIGTDANYVGTITVRTLRSNNGAMLFDSTTTGISFAAASSIVTTVGALTLAPVSGSNLALTVAGAGNIAFTLGTGTVTLTNTAQIKAASGVVSYSVVSTALTQGSGGSVILPNVNMSGAANDAARDALAGNVDGAIAIDTGVAGRIYIRDAGAWKFALAA